MGKTASPAAAKPYVAVVLLQCSYAGMILLSKAAMSAGMKPSIFVTYRQVFATLALLPFGFFFKSQESSPITWTGLFKIFFIASLVLALNINLFLAGLEHISATFGTAVQSIVPGFVFMMAVCFRIERLEITKWHGMAKVVGTYSGCREQWPLLSTKAHLATFIPHLIISYHQNPHHNSDHQKTHTEAEWIKGSALAIVAQLFYAMWLTMQAPLLKQFPGKLRLTLLQCGFSSITAAVYAAAVERNLAAWKLGWNIQLLSVAYCVIIVTGISYWLQAWVKGRLCSYFWATCIYYSCHFICTFSRGNSPLGKCFGRWAARDWALLFSVTLGIIFVLLFAHYLL